jgi:hypothetical protein
MVPMHCVTAIKLGRHTGIPFGAQGDCRYPVHRDKKDLRHPWLLGSGNPCRNDVSVGADLSAHSANEFTADELV